MAELSGTERTVGVFLSGFHFDCGTCSLLLEERRLAFNEMKFNLTRNSGLSGDRYDEGLEVTYKPMQPRK